MKNLTENQQQLIDQWVLEFTQMNESKISSNNPLSEIFEDFSSDKAKLNENRIKNKIIHKSLKDKILSNLNQIASYFDELGYSDFVEPIKGFDNESPDKCWLSIKVFDRIRNIHADVIIFGTIVSDAFIIGEFLGYKNHRITYKIGSESWYVSDINDIIKSESFIIGCKRFFNAVEKFNNNINS